VVGFIGFNPIITMTTQQIIKLARRKLLEVTTDVLPDDVILDYANSAYVDVWKRVFPNSGIKTTTLTLVNGQVALPATVGTLYDDGIDDAGNKFIEVPIADFNRGEHSWAMTIEEGVLKVTPSTTPTITVRYWEKPPALTNSVNPSIDEFFHEPIIYGIIWRAHEDLQDEELTTYYKQRFTQELTERISAQSNYEENNQRGTVMFNHTRLI
jgi:hypothetical protein